jgi:hypothetical protein
MSTKGNYQGLSLLGGVGVLLYLAHRVGKSGYPSGGFNNGDELPVVPSRTISAQVGALAQRQGQGDVWLGETAVLPGSVPEYVVILDLVDDTKIPGLDNFQTPVARPYALPGRSLADLAWMGPREGGVIQHQAIGGITSKSAFFKAAELIEGMVWKDSPVIDLYEPGLRVSEGRTQVVPSAAQGGPERRYRLNLVALPARQGMILPPDPRRGGLPFSPLFLTFEIYGDFGLARLAYAQALRAIQGIAQGNIRVPMSRRRLR